MLERLGRGAEAARDSSPTVDLATAEPEGPSLRERSRVPVQDARPGGQSASPSQSAISGPATSAE